VHEGAVKSKIERLSRAPLLNTRASKVVAQSLDEGEVARIAEAEKSGASRNIDESQITLVCDSFDRFRRHQNASARHRILCTEDYTNLRICDLEKLFRRENTSSKT
jgi:hypothetical protein